MKVLSLYDGISCGMVALERAGISVERYVAYKIDKYAVTVSSKNYPMIEHKGDVFDGDFTEYKGFDILIGGSPCTYWSIAKSNRETTPDGMGGKLFMEYVRALRESGCKWFLYENNHSIHKDIKDYISRELGVQPIMINSARVSGQQRKRCYWTNIPGVCQPDDKGIMLADVLESGVSMTDKSYCMTASYSGAEIKNTLERKQRSMVAEPVGCAQRGRYIESGNRHKKCEGGTAQHIEVRTDGKANCITRVNKDSMVCEPVRLGEINGSKGQANRVYSVRGKSVCLSANGGGGGAKTGLYKIDLPDGDYIIRKLTPVEAERLQTLPDNYTEGISNTQRYKCIGNGWTVDVIAHILRHINQNNGVGE